MKSQLFLVYKPWRMVSQFITNDAQQRKKRFLGELGQFPPGSMAVGRLDEDSEGLLLITTNGMWSNTINTSQAWQKEYYAQVDGVITEQALLHLQNGVTISVNGQLYQTKPCEVHMLPGTPDLPETKQRIRDDRHGPTSWISITVHEGKFRQVRKMTSAVGFATLRLVRVRIGIFTLADAQAGAITEVTNRVLEATIL